MVWAAVGDLCPLAHAMFMLSSQYNYKYIQRTALRQDVLARARELDNKMTAEGA